MRKMFKSSENRKRDTFIYLFHCRNQREDDKLIILYILINKYSVKKSKKRIRYENEMDDNLIKVRYVKRRIYACTYAIELLLRLSIE